MTVARIVWWKLKPGTRDEATGKIDEHMNEIKGQNGYRGFLLLHSADNPDRFIVVSIWENEQTMAKAEKDVYPKVVESLTDLLIEPPMVSHQKVHTLDVAKILA